MQMITFKLKPKQLFGIILALTGVIVIAVTFISNHPGEKANAVAQVSCKTEEERRAYLTGLGYELSDEEKSRQITIPEEFNEIYENYNDIQKQQGFDLETYKGRTAVLYTFGVTNYQDNERVIADLMVLDGMLIGADLCDPSADEGFLIPLGENNGASG